MIDELVAYGLKFKETLWIQVKVGNRQKSSSSVQIDQPYETIILRSKNQRV